VPINGYEIEDVNAAAKLIITALLEWLPNGKGAIAEQQPPFKVTANDLCEFIQKKIIEYKDRYPQGWIMFSQKVRAQALAEATMASGSIDGWASDVPLLQ